MDMNEKGTDMPHGQMGGREVLTAMDVVLRLEEKVDLILEDHEKRIRATERGGIILRGVWLTIGVVTSVITGGVGLTLGVMALMGSTS